MTTAPLPEEGSQVLGPQRLTADQSVYLLVKAVLLFNHKCVVQTPGKSSEGTEQGGQGQKYERLGDLVLCTKSKASCHRPSDGPQKWDSTQEQDQLKEA